MRAVHFIAVIAPNAAGVETVTPTLSDNPGETTYASDVYPRTVWDMLAWDGYLFIGIGDSAHNAAVPPIWFFDGNTYSDADGVSFTSHQLDRFVITGGKVYALDHDPNSGTTGSLYPYVSGATWGKSTPVSLASCAHVYDKYHDGTYLWSAVGASSGQNSIRRSSDNGATWSNYKAPATGCDVYPSRSWTFFVVNGTLYASTNYVYYTTPPAWTAYNDPWVNTVKWNGSSWEHSGVNFAPNDTLQVGYTEVEPEVFEISSVGRIPKAVTFGSSVFYIVGETITDHDFSPTNLYRVDSALTPTRLTFMGDAKVHDLLVHNNALYALCNEFVGDTYTTSVYVTTDGSTWTAALQFVHTDTYTFARSFAFYDEELYFGYGCYYDQEGAGAGKIVKTSLTTVIILAGGGAPIVAPTITNSTLDAATYGVSYSDTVDVTGDAPITFAVTSGSLPTGLSLNTSTGAITGTPTFSGTPGATSESASFTITATNAGGSDAQAYTLTLNHTLNTYLVGLSPVLYYKFNETSGDLINYGSLAATGNAPLSGTGITQASGGATFAGGSSTGRYTVTNNAAFNELQAATWIMIGTFTANTTFARVFQMGVNFRLSQLGTNTLNLVVQRASGNETLTSSNNMINTTPTPLAVFATATASGGIALFRGISGAVSAQGTANAQTGAISAQAGALAIGNENAAPFTRQHPGTMTLFACVGSVISSTQRESITTLAGV